MESQKNKKMHEKLVLNIISRKIESIQKKFELDLPEINIFLHGNKAQVGGFNINIDCACSLNVYFKDLKNSDDEGVVLEVHISKSPSYIFSIDVDLIRSNGQAFAMDDFTIDLRKEKSVRCKVFADLYNAIDNYYDLMKKIIQEEYLSRLV